MCGETRIPRDMCAGKHYTWGNTYHYDTGIDVKMCGIFTTILLYTHEEYSDTATTTSSWIYVSRGSHSHSTCRTIRDRDQDFWSMRFSLDPLIVLSVGPWLLDILPNNPYKCLLSFKNTALGCLIGYLKCSLIILFIPKQPLDCMISFWSRSRMVL